MRNLNGRTSFPVGIRAWIERTREEPNGADREIGEGDDRAIFPVGRHFLTWRILQPAEKTRACRPLVPC